MKGGKIRAVAMRLPSSLLEQTDANMLGMSGDIYNSSATVSVGEPGQCRTRTLQTF
jgi:hypothetical protein